MTGFLTSTVVCPHTETELTNDTADVGRCFENTLKTIGETMAAVQSVLQHGGNRLMKQEISIRMEMRRLGTHVDDEQIICCMNFSLAV